MAQILAWLVQKPSQAQNLPQCPLGPPRRAQDDPRWAQGGPNKGRQTMIKSRKIIPGAFLGPPWGQLWPTLGSTWPCQAHLEAKMPSKLRSSNPKTTRRPPKSFASILKVLSSFNLSNCQALDGNLDSSKQDAQEPINQSTSLRHRSCGMREGPKMAFLDDRRPSQFVRRQRARAIYWVKKLKQDLL